MSKQHDAHLTVWKLVEANRARATRSTHQASEALRNLVDAIRSTL